MRKSKLDTLEPKEVEFIEMIFKEKNMSHNEKTTLLANKHEVTTRTIRNWWVKLGLKEGGDLPEQLKRARERFISEDADVLLVTGCQNKTFINQGLLEKMEKYRDFIIKKLGKKAEIVIIPTRYRNPVSTGELSKYRAEEWWVNEVDKYLHYYNIEFGDCTISNTRVRPTAINPLTGYEALAGEGHLILAHPRVHWKTLDRFKGDPLKTMSTSGYISRMNYTESKAGRRGEIHHVYGFSVIEKKENGRCIPPRFVKAKPNGDFTDLCYHVTNEGVEKQNTCDTWVWGDIHRRVLDRKKHEATVRLMKKFRPDKVIFHDLVDGNTFNPHEKKDYFIRRRKIVEGRYKIGEEVEESLDYLQEFVDEGFKVIVIESNHHRFLDRLVNDEDWKKDLHNSDKILEYALMQQTVDLRDYGGIYGYLVKKRFGDKVEYVKYAEPCKIQGYQNFHGEFGANGARGSQRTFRKANVKIIHAHTHRPYLAENVTCVGTSTELYQYYNNKGMSGWAHADSIITNGKNQLWVYDDEYMVSTLL